jgi:hypothetical protein
VPLPQLGGRRGGTQLQARLCEVSGIADSRLGMWGPILNTEIDSMWGWAVRLLCRQLTLCTMQCGMRKLQQWDRCWTNVLATRS